MKTKITVIDDLHPEDNAMLQALQSRSPASVEERLKKVKEAGSGNFMDKFYVGYGHKSIGDCGTTTIYIEGVTMLCAKAIQDWPLYSGQEASTRYMDFSEAEFHNPLKTPEGETIQERWRKFYLESRAPVIEHLRQKYPRQEGEEEKVYERAINARSFDILRSFLPAGAATNLSWHTNLRQASDHLDWLRLHPDRHVSDVAHAIFKGISKKYPHSFSSETIAHEEFRKRVLGDHYFLMPQEIVQGIHVFTRLSQKDIEAHDLSLLGDRPRGVEVPWYFDNLGQIQSTFPLDFGSYRDLQRHRNGTIRMPLLTTELGFHSWYLEALPDALRQSAESLLFDQEVAIKRLDCSNVVAQNYIAMGYQVPCQVTQGLPGFVYRLELRSGKMIHPTLRQVVHAEIRQFQGFFPDIPLHVDMDPDSWSVRRGKQTIEEKGSV